MHLKIIALAVAALPAGALAGPCLQWQQAERIGSLDPAFLREASGTAASRAHPGRLYHHNNSGDGPYFYITDATGDQTRRVKGCSGFEPRDVEDMALGALSRRKGLPRPWRHRRQRERNRDHGEVRRNRRERAAFADEVAPLRIVEARYPDGPHDAESFALHPNGDLYLLYEGPRYSEQAPAHRRNSTA